MGFCHAAMFITQQEQSYNNCIYIAIEKVCGHDHVCIHTHNTKSKWLQWCLTTLLVWCICIEELSISNKVCNALYCDMYWATYGSYVLHQDVNNSQLLYVYCKAFRWETFVVRVQKVIHRGLCGSMLVDSVHIQLYWYYRPWIIGGQWVGQGQVYHKVPLIIIVLNILLLPFDNDILYIDNCMRSFYSHFHH